jgi:hypothetical protein
MNLVTDDAITFLPVELLQEVVLKAIDKQANVENPGDPDRAICVARDRKTAVLGAMINMHPYPEDCKAILYGFWKRFGGRE